MHENSRECPSGYNPLQQQLDMYMHMHQYMTNPPLLIPQKK